MPQYPDCLSRRYQALDDLIKELGAAVSDHSHEVGSTELCTADPGIKLMCKFWNILKEDPDCDLQHVVQQRMVLNKQASSFVNPHNITCYACSQDNQRSNDKMKTSLCCSSGSAPPTTNVSASHDHCIKSDGAVPLSKVLCNLKEAASVDKKCSERITELKAIQKQVAQQVANLEQREKEGTQMMKQADCMWTCMEETYKQKIAESIEKQKELMKQQKEVESHVSKWRKSKKELDLQMKQLEKCEKEMKEKINQKTSDLKCMKTEIVDLKKRIENNAKELNGVKNSSGGKKRASADKVAKITEDLKQVQEKISNEHKIKKQKEEDGHLYIKEAREDLQNICRILLQKKLQNEDLKAETEGIIDEIELLKKTTDQCQDKCKNKQDSLSDALRKINGDIASFQVRCTKCHACVDTQDARRFCTDCPKCQEDRECLYKERQCTADPDNDCICISVKRKFLDNVFENMYTVLERQSKLAPGKALAEQVLACLQNSRNGKLTEPIRKALQEFVLVTVKKNLNLTIIGGAVKTRCEMDPDTYKQLMNCLTKLTVAPPEKKDKGTVAKKDSCKRWGGTGECNCPSGPKYCVCTRKAPPPPHDPAPCPQLEEDKQDIGQTPACPHHPDMPCGPDCGNIKVSDTVKNLVKTFNPPSCSGQSCTYTKNMRAAQCMLGQDSLKTPAQSKGYMTSAPFVPDLSKYRGSMMNTPFAPDLNEEMPCACGCGSEKSCSCYNDVTSQPRTKIIHEVMGRYTDVTPIEKLLRSEVPITEHINVNGKRCKNDKKIRKFFKEYNNENIIATKDGNVKNHENNESKGSNIKEEVLTNQRIKENTQESTVIIKESPSKVITEEEKQARKENEEINEKLSKHRDVHVPVVQAEVLTKAYKESGTEPYITVNMKNQHRISLQKVVNNLTSETTPKDLFKIAIPNDNGETNHEFTELTTTSSGSIQMALDEKTISSIESKTRENPNLTVTLKKTISGHFVVEFNKCDCNSSESRRVMVNRTDSGNIIMEVHKNLVDTIQPSVIKSTNIKKALPKKSSVSVGLTKRPKMHSCNNQDSNEKENYVPIVNVADFKEKNSSNIVNLKERSNAYTSSNSMAQTNLITSGIEEKKGYCDISRRQYLTNQDDDIDQERVQIKLVTDSTSTSSADLKKLDSDIKKQKIKVETKNDSKKGRTNIKNESAQVSSLKDNFQNMIDNNCTYIDVTVLGENGVESDIKAELTRTQSGQIVIDAKEMFNAGNISNRLKEYPISFVRINSRYLLNFNEHDEKANALLKRSSSGKIHVVLQNPVLKLDENNAAILKARDEFFRVRVKGVENSDPIPTTVMRITSSGNYVFVLDKEFENPYLKIIKECVGAGHECYVRLSKTQSDCYVIDFNKKMDNVNNALLIKSNSGNIKVLVQGPAFEAIHKNPESDQRSSTVFEELFTKLPHSSREFHRENLAKSKYLETKSFSDSRLYNRVRIQDQNSLFTMPSAVLKRTTSGKYAVVLNKESKSTFINNLKSYIANSGQGFVPIMKTDQGDIIISLKRDHKGVYGTVKITPSGNIYVTVDEHIIKQMENDSINNTNELISEQSSQSVHMIGTIMHPQDKEVTTTCHAQPESCSCDANKCVCKELQLLESSWLTNADGNAKGVIFDCNRFNVEKTSMFPNPKIVMTQRNLYDPSFYVIDTTVQRDIRQSDSSIGRTYSIISQHRNDTVHYPVKEHSFHNGEQSYTNIYQKRDTSNLDYLEHLPPQLPVFLRGFD